MCDIEKLNKKKKKKNLTLDPQIPYGDISGGLNIKISNNIYWRKNGKYTGGKKKLFVFICFSS